MNKENDKLNNIKGLIIKELSNRIQKIQKNMNFHIEELDHNNSEFESYHRQEYLINYYKKQELIDLLEFVSTI